MRTRTIIPILIILTLCFASLACAVSSEDEEITATEFDLPTPAPSPAPPEPTPAPEDIITASPTAPAQVTPLTLQATGTKTDYAASTNTECQAQASAVLIIRSDGRAELTTTGPLFSDHINCTTSGDETYILKGTVDPATEMVSIDYCNNDNFIGAGSVSYAGGSITGSVRCISKYSNQMTLNIP